MLIQLTFKTPDVFDCVEYYIKNARIDGEDEEDEDEQYQRQEETREFIRKYVKYDEYISVEFDTEAKTVKVLEQR